MTSQQEKFPFVGFDGERYYNHHYLVNFGNARVSVTMNTKGWIIGVWGVWMSERPNFPPMQDKLSVLAALHHLKNTFEGNP